MKRLLTLLFTFLAIQLQAQEWDIFPVPAMAGADSIWELQDNVSDDFNYTFEGTDSKVNFGNDKWYNFYHNHWDGPGYTYWKHQNVTVENGNLIITAGYTTETSKGGSYGVASGCVTSNAKVVYPVYVESAISVANIELASCFWLLSPDDTEEIDIIENYGGVNFYKQFTHISHHSFVRNPFTDYQPRDWNSWYPDSRVNNSYGWGDWCWNNGGERRYMRMGVYWKSPKHFEYYIDGELVRVMYYNAIATNYNGTWQYTYFKSLTWDVNGYKLPTNISSGNQAGYTDVVIHSTSSSFDMDKLKEASNASNGYNVIDPAWFQGGDDDDLDGNGFTVEAKGFTKELDIIINVESQGWLLDQTPSQASLNDPTKNQMKVDWVRVYKPVPDNGGVRPVTGVSLDPTEKVVANGSSYNVTPTFVPHNATNKNVTFTSSNEAVATVNPNGVVSAVGLGDAVITVTTEDGNFTATSNVKVIENGAGNEFIIEAEDFDRTGGTIDDEQWGGPGEGVGITDDNLGINWVNSGDWVEYDFEVPESGNYKVTFLVSTPSDGAAITLFTNTEEIGDLVVPNNGSWGDYQEVTLDIDFYLEAGQNTFKVLASGSNDWQWNMDKMIFTPYTENIIAVEGIELDVTSADVERFKTLQLSATVLPENASNKNYSWESSNTFVATVDQNGIVTGVQEGEVEITAVTAEGGIRATATITVTPATSIHVSGINIDIYNIELNINETATITATILPAEATNQNVIWSSSNETIATVTNGIITALAEGNCTVTVESEDGSFSQNISVVVKAEAPTSIDNVYNPLVIYPNPNKGSITLRGLSNKVYKIIIYNLNGQNVYSVNTYFENEYKIDLSNQPKGVYLVQVIDEETSYSRRIIKE
ncbi:carbohydrate-binding protein [Flammeovirga sp. MY04]|uniref:Ig-like domain-containing protein n=1 Tax=Flammeovirga sp. MY04 TaxID=1191459 RepID=UPI000806388A|nr:Ig-like domain-containing protein [Flammeovirga sp. MY04]ANQ48276.1 carbohydrate-binding protein [Flammeovirga sp. MY04]